jgi:protein TonB
VSTKSAVEAAYLNGWRQKVERVGNANYPATAMFGNLRMLVVIAWDGELKDVRILQSSGHTSLDTAALRIVRMAAPYQDFPVEMRKHYDQLEIIRTWEFSRTGNRLDS